MSKLIEAEYYKSFNASITPDAIRIEVTDPEIANFIITKLRREAMAQLVEDQQETGIISTKAADWAQAVLEGTIEIDNAIRAYKEAHPEEN